MLQKPQVPPQPPPYSYAPQGTPPGNYYAPPQAQYPLPQQPAAYYPPPQPQPQQQPAPANSAIALAPQYIAQQPVTLKVRSSGVVESNGAPIVDIKNRGLGSKKEIHALNGSPLFTLKSHTFSSNDYTLHTPSGAEVLTIISHGFFGTKMDVHFRNALPPHKNVMLRLQGHGFTETKFTVDQGDREILRIDNDGFWGTKYKVQVPAGFDQALATVLTLVMIDVKKKKSSSSGGGGGGGA